MSIRLSGGIPFALIPHDVTAEFDFTVVPTLPTEISSLGGLPYIITDVSFYNASLTAAVLGFFNDTNPFSVPVSFNRAYSNIQATKVKITAMGVPLNVTVVGLSFSQIQKFGGAITL